MYAGSADRSLDSTKRDIFENFRSYNLEKPELIRMDNHLLDRHIQLRTNSTICPARTQTQGVSAAGDSANRVSAGPVHVRAASSSDRADSAFSPSEQHEYESNSSRSISRQEVGHFDGMFDVIVTDPPYGIRAGAKKSGTVDAQAPHSWIKASNLFYSLSTKCEQRLLCN